MLVKQPMVELLRGLMKPLMKEHGPFLQEEYGSELFLHIFHQRVVFSLPASDVVNELQNLPGELLAEVAEEQTAHQGLRIVRL